MNGGKGEFVGRLNSSRGDTGMEVYTSSAALTSAKTMPVRKVNSAILQISEFWLILNL